MQDYKELIVWQKAYSLTLKIYKATEVFPKSGIIQSCKSIEAS